MARLSCHSLYGGSITLLDEIRGEIWHHLLILPSPLLGLAIPLFLISLYSGIFMASWNALFHQNDDNDFGNGQGRNVEIDKK